MFYRRALAIGRITLGEDHPLLSATLEKLAEMLEKQVRREVYCRVNFWSVDDSDSRRGWFD